MSELIPREFIQQLINRVDLVDLIETRIPLKKKTGQNFFACCPFHQEKSASFSVSQAKQFYYCFGCGAHGNAIDFLMQYDRLAFPEAVEALAKQLGLEVPREKNAFHKTENHEALYRLMAETALDYQKELRHHPQAERAIRYLKQRGLTGEIAKTFGIGYAPPGWDHVLTTLGADAAAKQHLFTIGLLIKKEEGGFYDRFRDRIMFPILDRQGRTIGFGGRVIDQGEPKYLNSPETPIFQKGHELYGLYQALQANRQIERIVIVEGYMDVIALFQQGITYAVATLGTATTQQHILKLCRYTDKLIFCFDGDGAGRKAAWRAMEVLLPLMHDGLQVKFMFLPEGEDPDTIVRKEQKTGFEQRLQSSLSLSEFFFQHLTETTDLTSAEGRARYYKLCKDYLDTIPENMFKEIMLAELNKKARIHTETTMPKIAYPKTFAKPEKQRPPSIVRLLLMLLVQHPELIECFTDPLPKLPLPGFDLLLKLVNELQKNPLPNTGALLEYWRDSPDEPALLKLAQLEHMIPLNGLKQEFMGLIQQLKKQAKKQLIDDYLSRAAIQGLTDEEKQTLTVLIQDQ